MIDLKINIDQLKNYLGTGLKFLTSKHQIEYGKTHELTLNGISIDSKGDLNIEFLYDDDLMFSNAMNKIFPICYRLSDLGKFIPELGFVPLDRLCEFTTTEINGNGEIESAEYDGDFHVTQMPDSMDWYRMQLLFQWNFWLFGDEYFDKGLVIDKLKKYE